MIYRQGDKLVYFLCGGTFAVVNQISTPAIWCVVVIIGLAGLVPQSFADGFQPSLFKWNYQPSICIFEPYDSQFPGLGSKMFDEAQDAVLDWQTKLNGGNAKGAWNFNLTDIPSSKSTSFDTTNCDIAMHFEQSPVDPNEKFNEAGVTIYKTFPKVSIIVYYLGVNLREQYETFWQNGTDYYTYQPIPYFTGYLASDPQIEMTIRHEVGHALGLGHYVVSDMELARIVEGSQDMPSIMVTTVFTYGVTHFDITQADVKEIQSIYGSAGLPKKSTQPLVANVIPEMAQNVINNTVNTVTGNTSTVKTTSVATKLPSWIKNIAKWWSLGKVSNDEFAGVMEYVINHRILKVPATPGAVNSSSIPSWVTKNAGDWADAKISDYEFIRGIQYLVSAGIIKLS